MTRDYSVASHDSASCSLQNCRYHISVYKEREVEGLVAKPDHFCFSYQRVDRLYVFFSKTDSEAMCLCKLQKLLMQGREMLI